MVENSTYKLTYVVDKETKELTVVVELVLRDEMKKPFQNLYAGYATVNGRPYDDEDLEHSVNAQFAAERIGHKHKEKILKKCKLPTTKVSGL